MNYIPVKTQVEIVDSILQIASDAIERRDHQTLEHLSRISTSLIRPTEGSPVTLFFDLGEYLYETATHLDEVDREDTWAKEAHKSLQESLLQAREINK